MKIKSFVRQMLRRCREYAQSPRGRISLAGIFVGFSLLAICHPFFATFGLSLTAVTAFAVAMAIGIEFGLRETRRSDSDGLAPTVRYGMLLLLLAAWVICLPWGVSLAVAVAGNIPADVMVAPGRELLFLVLAAGLLLSFPVYCLARMPICLAAFLELSQHPADDSSESTHRWWQMRTRIVRWWKKRGSRVAPRTRTDVVRGFLLAASIGFVVAVMLVAPWFGVRAIAFLVAAGSLTIGASSVLGKTEVRVNETPAPTLSESRQFVLWRWLCIACLGALLAVVLRMVNQLSASAAYLVYFEWAAILVGFTFGLSRRRQHASGGSVSGVVLMAAAWAVVTLGGYSWLTELSLLLNAYVSQPWLLMPLRCLLVGVGLTPLGYALGSLSVAASKSDANSTAIPSPQIFAFVTGYLVVRWVAFSRWPMADLLLTLAWSLSLLAVFHYVFQHRATGRRIALPEKKPQRVALATVVLLLIAGPFLRGQYDPVRTARQLFATNVFVARMQGLTSQQLSFLDEGREVARREGERGTLTIWRYRGNQLQIRENGVPKSIVSTAPHICPHFTAEMMQAVMPLALHEQPNRVMILGIGGGLPLTTSLSFPVSHVTCVDSDRELVNLLESTVWSESGDRPFQDNRLRYLPIDPAVAVACRGDEYDVIISSPDQSALLQSTPYFTQRFYRGVSRQLAADGIFCQRFHQVDYGPMPLQSTVKTMQTVFRNVVAIEIASGEMALLATNSEKGLSRENMLTRFQSPHVRRSLSEIGWDWSVPMNLTAYSHDGLKEFADATPNSVNTAANGRLAFRLPQEVMRWAPKWKELLTLIGPHGSRFAQSEGIKADDPELLRRLSEVTGQRKLMTAFPDHWWAYRKSLKKQIKERPRTLIQRVGAETRSGQFHPEDRRRMRYFAALDRAAENPTSATIYRVAAFEQPYDPLLSYFVHQETAELMKRSKEKDYREELRHRLHSVYFAHSHDRSVRNVAGALQLIAEQETATDSPTIRWDQMNALMQVLKGRWAFRGLMKPKSVQIVLNDIDRCLRAVDRAVSTMDSIRDAADVAVADWEARRSVLDRSLIRPLRTYRKNLLTHHLNEQAKLRKILESIDESPDEDGDSKKPTTAEPNGGVTPPVAN